MATLFVVGTPIGNLSDASPRMVETLRRCALIAAEDTRVTAKLCNHFAIQTPLTSCHQYNERSKAERLVEKMVAEDQEIALVTDAGMPCISDPGHLLVAAAWEAGIPVLSVPGPSAMTAAVSISGMDARVFAFYGFLPRAQKELREKLMEIARSGPVAVAYESPHRVVALLRTLADLFPECAVCVCCDLTKRYELAHRGPVDAVAQTLSGLANVEKGEYCVVMDFSRVQLPEEVRDVPSLEARLVDRLLNGMPLHDAMDALIAQGERRNEVYRASVRLKDFLRSESIP